MERFKLDKAKGTLKKCTTSRKKSKDDGKPVLLNDVHFLIDVDDRCKDAVDYVFPSYSDVENAVAGRDGAHRGVKMQANGDVPELNVSIFDGTGNTEVWKFERVEIHGRPELLINSIGDSRFALRLNAKLSKKDMSKLVDYIDADIYISADVAQPALPGIEPKETVTMYREGDGDPVQQNLDGSLTADDLLAFRSHENMSRSEFVEWLAEKGLDVSAKSLQRYETGERDIPDELSTLVRGVMEPEQTAA